jgi:hypothetical protein
VTLRGDGPGKTIFDLRGSGETAILIGTEDGPQTQTYTNITGGSSAGSTSMTLASGAGVSAGMYLYINELNDSSFVTIQGEYAAGNTCNWCDGVDGTRTLGQIVEVTGVSGNTVQFQPPLYITYQSTLSPRAYPFQAAAKYAGVESLTMHANNTGYRENFLIGRAAYCWLKNVEGDFADGDHAQLIASFRPEVRDSYFHDGFSHGPGQRDDDLFLGHKTSAALIENNIFYRQHASVMLNWGAAGNVIAYNYSSGNYHETYLHWQIADYGFHGAHPMFNLFEGNVGGKYQQDSVWGSSSHSTVLRNWFTGATFFAPPIDARGPIDTANGYWEDANPVGIALDFTVRFNNLIGNVVGSVWQQQHGGSYMAVAPASLPMPVTMSFGYDGSLNAHDGAAYTSAIVHGNWDFITRSQHFDSSIATKTIPATLYLAGKPSWFGTLAWPPIDPVNNPAALDANVIPAGYRFTHGTPPPGAL